MVRPSCIDHKVESNKRVYEFYNIMHRLLSSLNGFDTEPAHQKRGR